MPRVDALLAEVFGVEAVQKARRELRAWLQELGIDQPSRLRDWGVADAPARVQAALASPRGRNFIGAQEVSMIDVMVVGAGIVGLAHAWAAARRGLRVVVVERDHRCVGASIRNFGFITVSGQPAGETWRRARASRDHWADVAAQAGIPIVQRGLWLLARRPLAQAVLEAFMATDMAEGNELYTRGRGGGASMPMLRTDGACAAMYSPHELRVESRHAIPRLAAWLSQRWGVRFHFGEAVLEVKAPRVRTAARMLEAERVVICPGTELQGVGRGALERHALKLTRLQMLRVRPEPGFVLRHR